MKYFLTAILMLFATASLALTSQQQEILTELKTNEPSVKDAIWSADTILKVGMIPNGSVRDGYANYVCNIVIEKGMGGRKVWVQIIDIVKLKNSGSWVTIGEARCN